MKSNVIVILMGLVCLISCQPQPEWLAEPKVNDQWSYRWKDYDSLGNIVDSADLSILSKQSNSLFLTPGWNPPQNDEFVCLFTDTGYYDLYTVDIPYGHYRMREDGLYNLGPVGGPQKVWLKYPGNAGEMYILQNIDYTYSEQRTILATNATVVVPAGTYTNQYLYELRSQGILLAHLWFNPNEWFVKYEVFDSTGTYVDYTYELVSYMAY